ncbi:hypothetical protein CBS101457_000637 [Exobasidium rhododendri]|nr:hypothetical protein CBS101457_000637 [Exobasidium rhododendri]
MASPTAIPHCETSAHHHCDTPAPLDLSSSFSRSPTGTSPNPTVSPIYTSAGRSAFSLPGPNSSSTSPTTTSWYSAGFASNSQRVRSPTTTFTAPSVTPQRDYFTDSTGNISSTNAHFRKASFGSGSRSSSISSADLMNEPLTPRPEGPVTGVPLGRVPSLPMGSSFDQIKGHRGSWGPNSHSSWNGLNTFRGNAVNLSSPQPQSGVDNTSAALSNKGMSGILRKFSFGSGQQPLKADLGQTANSPAMPAPILTAQKLGGADVAEPVEIIVRGRQGSLGGNPSQKRRPSPMGERLLMGHFNAH